MVSVPIPPLPPVVGHDSRVILVKCMPWKYPFIIWKVCFISILFKESLLYHIHEYELGYLRDQKTCFIIILMCLMMTLHVNMMRYLHVMLPDGRRSDDHTSCAPQSALTGGQLMTGYVAFPDRTGPRPLLLPATATKTVGIPSDS